MDAWVNEWMTLVCIYSRERRYFSWSCKFYLNEWIHSFDCLMQIVLYWPGHPRSRQWNLLFSFTSPSAFGLFIFNWIVRDLKKEKVQLAGFFPSLPFRRLCSLISTYVRQFVLFLPFNRRPAPDARRRRRRLVSIIFVHGQTQTIKNFNPQIFCFKCSFER